jgi:CRISPR system Cascade subunit CasE
MITFSTVDFSGELPVIDPIALAVALRDGIGHSKAFGCGLMLVRRL